MDSNLEALLYLDGIARIRQYYRTLGPEAAKHFSPESGRWPENPSSPSLRMGPFVGLITTTASLVAFLNSIVAGSAWPCLRGDCFGRGGLWSPRSSVPVLPWC